MAIVRKEVDLNHLPKMSEKDLARFDAITDEDIDYSDIPELGDDFFKRAVFARKLKKEKPRVMMVPVHPL